MSSSHLERIAKALREGFSFGPRCKCVCCHGTIEDPDVISRGICERCFEAIEALKEERPA